jgi:DNA-binding helix-hairpin-helix protein with protein kinase domain
LCAAPAAHYDPRVRMQRVSNHQPVMLGAELGRGGEGIVHLVDDAPGLVAKIYRKPPSPAKLEKLATMARHAAPELLRAAAWPVDLLRDESDAIRGFLMPRIAARHDVHELYSPKSRKRRFPKADFRFVVHAATNLSRAFALVHAAGHVIGDVNHGNALIGEDGTVVLIDCDSFQVCHQDVIHFCDVGSPLFTPPELCGASFRGLRRELAHDAFGLAVLVFHLLFLGRHPFAGRRATGDLPIERAIAEAQFAYGVGAGAMGISRPPRTLSLGTFGERIAALFERAFASPGAAQRPAAVEWVEALHELGRQLQSCASSTAHFHPPAASCCWCEIEERSGLRAYGTEEDETTLAIMARLWSRIEAVAPPPPTPPRPSLPASDLPAQVVEDMRTRYLWGTLGLLAAAGTGLLALPLTYGLLSGGGAVLGSGSMLILYLSRMARLRPAGDAMENALASWENACSDEPFARCRERLETARERLLEVAAMRERYQRQLPAYTTELWRMRYLDDCLIRDAQLPGFAEGVVSMLESYGIEGADEVVRMPQSVERLLGSSAARALRAWAEQCDRQLDGVAVGAVPVPDEVLARDRALRWEEFKLLNVLRDGADELSRVRTHVLKKRDDALQRFIDARRAYIRVRGELHG